MELLCAIAINVIKSMDIKEETEMKAAGTNVILLAFLGLFLRMVGMNYLGHYILYGLMVTIGNALYHYKSGGD